MPKYDVKVQLTGNDGNAFAIIARVSRALKEAGLQDEAESFAEQAMDSESYNALLVLCMETVDVS